MLSCLTLVYICKIVNKNALIYLEEDNVLLNDSFNHLSRKSFVENHFPAFVAGLPFSLIASYNKGCG